MTIIWMSERILKLGGISDIIISSETLTIEESPGETVK